MATEGLIGLQEIAFTASVPPYRFACERNLLGFREPGGANSGLLTIEELEKGRDYELFISNFNGLIQYQLGDLIRVEESYPRLAFRILGRDKVALNAAGERLTEAQVMDAFQEFKREADGSLKIDYFFAFPEVALDGLFRYRFILVLSAGTILPDHANMLDRELRRVSMIVSDLRHVGILGQVSLEAAPDVVARRYSESAVKGNAKIRSFFASRVEYLDFLA
jgi:hypothetical protein